MAKQLEALTDELTEFIAAQHIFFVATAGPEGKINLSPKGMDSLRVQAPNTISWLNMTGSGNETAAHLRTLNRITLMWCAFEGKPLILRVYGTAKVIQRDSADWEAAVAPFPGTPGARQVIVVEIELVQTSCGFGVPLMQYEQDRDTLLNWAAKKGDEGIKAYWQEKNRVSLDGISTGIPDK